MDSTLDSVFGRGSVPISTTTPTSTHVASELSGVSWLTKHRLPVAVAVIAIVLIILVVYYFTVYSKKEELTQITKSQGQPPPPPAKTLTEEHKPARPVRPVPKQRVSDTPAVEPTTPSKTVIDADMRVVSTAEALEQMYDKNEEEKKKLKELEQQLESPSDDESDLSDATDQD